MPSTVFQAVRQAPKHHMVNLFRGELGEATERRTVDSSGLQPVQTSGTVQMVQQKGGDRCVGPTTGWNTCCSVGFASARPSTDNPIRGERQAVITVQALSSLTAAVLEANKRLSPGILFAPAPL